MVEIGLKNHRNLLPLHHHVIEAWMENLCGKCPKSLEKKTIASINSKDVNIFDGHIQASCACTKLHPQTNQMNYPIMIGFDPHILAYIGFV